MHIHKVWIDQCLKATTGSYSLEDSVCGKLSPLFLCFSFLLDLTFHVNVLLLSLAQNDGQQEKTSDDALMLFFYHSEALQRPSKQRACDAHSIKNMHAECLDCWQCSWTLPSCHPRQLSLITCHWNTPTPPPHTDMWCEYATCLLVDRLAKETSWILNRHMWVGKERVTHTQNNLHCFLCANNRQRKPKHATMETVQLFWIENTGSAM